MRSANFGKWESDGMREYVWDDGFTPYSATVDGVTLTERQGDTVERVSRMVRRPAWDSHAGAVDYGMADGFACGDVDGVAVAWVDGAAFELTDAGDFPCCATGEHDAGARYMPACDVLPGDILPDASRAPVAGVVVHPGSHVRVTFAGTTFTRDYPYGGPGIGFANVRVNRPAAPVHVCDSECWAYGARYGMRPGCDAFAARAAADAELAADQAIYDAWAGTPA
jgi:hypothetical protein